MADRTAGLVHALRRGLARAEQGKALSADEAAVLLRGPRRRPGASAARSPRRLRDLGWGDTVTYSRKVFIPLTMLCRDHCHYCTFAKPPAKLDHPFLTPDEVVAIAEAGRRMGCKEALFTLGDRPEDRYPLAARWLAERGYGSTLEYVRAMAIRVVEQTGLLPHLNPGVMSYEDLARLKHVSASMGLMLETSSPRLSERGGPHFNSPDKVPAVRLRTIEDAGRLAIPFTTGILVGIGETPCGTSGEPVRDPGGAPALPARPGGHRPELPSEAGHGDALGPRAAGTGVPRDDRRRPDRARSARQRAGAAEPVRSRPAPAAPGCRHQRLGRRVAADARSRQPRAAVAGIGSLAASTSARGKVAARTAHDLSAVRRRTRSRGSPAGCARRSRRSPPATGSVWRGSVPSRRRGRTPTSRGSLG